jgi:hypothetical protein
MSRSAPDKQRPRPDFVSARFCRRQGKMPSFAVVALSETKLCVDKYVDRCLRFLSQPLPRPRFKGLNPTCLQEIIESLLHDSSHGIIV